MNGQNLDRKLQEDVTRVKKDVNTLKDDGYNKVTQVGQVANRSSEDMAAKVNSGVAQLSSEFGKVKDDASKTVADATTTVKKNVGNGLSEYNAKAAEVANKLPGDFDAKAGKYPWVAITLALIVGFLLRGFFMPDRNV